MRKALAIILVLVLAPMAFGAHLTSGGKDTLVLGPGKDVTVGDVITVDLTFDCELTGIRYIDFISSAPNPGDVRPVISSVGSWAPCMQPDSDPGTLVSGDIMDAEGVLTFWTLGTGELGVAAGTILYSFSATVNGVGRIDPYMGPSDLYYDKSNPGGTNYGLVMYGVEIVPEPMTIALLGLGGLFLAHRRK